MSKAAFVALWCFVLVLPWDVVLYMPVLGSIPRLVGLAASAVGVAYILARRRIRPLSWFHLFAVLFVLWAGVSVFWSIDAEANRVPRVFPGNARGPCDHSSNPRAARSAHEGRPVRACARVARARGETRPGSVSGAHSNHPS